MKTRKSNVIALLGAVLVSLAWASAKAEQPTYDYELVDVKVNEGPLSCYVKKGFLLDWTKIPSKTSDVDPASDESPEKKDGAVKYENGGRRDGAVLWWTRPVYKPEVSSVYMELFVSQLRNPPGPIRLIVYGGYGKPPRAGEKLMVKGPEIGMVGLFNSSSVSGTATFKMGVPTWPEKISILVRASDGGACGDDLIAYFWDRREY
jgi:hypothetical protein